MVDNSSLPVASGNETFANDDIGGVKYPRPKVNWGPDGTANDVDVASGKPLPVQLRGSDGTDRSNSLPVVATNAGTFAVQDSRFATEDAAASADPIGPHLIAVRRDTLSTSQVSADGDVIAVPATNKGKIHVAAELRLGDIVADTGSGTGGSATQRVIMDSSQLASLITSQGAFSAGAQQVSLPSDHPAIVTGGNVAHDAADSGNPQKAGAKATTSLSGLTLVADADRTNLFAGIDGVQITRPHCNLEDIVTGNATNTDGTSTQCIAAQAAGIKTYLVSVVLANTSATAITVDIKDGSTVKTSLPLPAGSGCVYNPPLPIPGTAATAWNFDGSAAATTVTCSMIGFKSKV